MIEAVLFDLWNTLAYFPSANSMTAEQERLFGKEVSQKIQEIFVAGHRYPMTTDEFLEKIQTIAPLDDANKEFERSFFELNDYTLYPDTIPTLAWLKEHGFKIGLISNCVTGTREQLDDLGIAQYCDAIVLSFEAGFMKPEADIFVQALREIDVQPADAIMVGDKVWQDMEGAQSAGIKGILLDRENKNDFTPRIQSLLELKAYVG